MIDKKVEKEINNLFLKKKFKDLIIFAEKNTTPYKRPSSVSNLIGISKIFQKNYSEKDVKTALDLFQETYLNDKKGPHGLNGLVHLTTIAIQFDQKYRNLYKYLSLSKDYYFEAQSNFKNNENFLRVGFLLFKYLLDQNNLKKIINEIYKHDIKSKILRSWCLIHNNYFYDWSQKDHYNQTNLSSKLFPKLNTKKINNNELSKDQKINIGFVSADLHLNHSTTFFLKNTIRFMDKNKFNVYIFSFAKQRPDDKSQNELRKLTGNWFDLESYDNQQTINLIQQKDINILIDLMGYTAPDRIEIFNSRICPLQISWLAYCNTLGFNTVDYLIADHNLILSDEEKYYSEKILRLPNIWNAHSGFDYERKQNDISNKKSKIFTFGSFNNFQKISLETIHTWSQILKSSSNFRLILKSSEYCSHVNLIEAFKKNKVENQIEILDRSNYKNKKDHLDLYNKIDLALDTFPYNGVTTTFEALWMGVPVVVLKGYNFNSRCGESIIKNCNLDYFIASNQKEYVEKSVHLANNADELNDYRKSLFEDVLSSPLFDTKKFSENFSNLLLKII